MSQPGIATTEQAATIIVVDDDVAHGTAVAQAVAQCARAVRHATTVASAIEMIAAESPDLVILDLNLPDGHGIEVLRRVRAAGNAPVLVCSGSREESDKVELLEAGADDFITKPVGEPELVARVRAQLRRARISGSAADTGETFVSGRLRIDFSAQSVTRGDRVVKLTPTENAIIRALATNAGRTMTHRELWEAVWGREFGDAKLHLRVHVTHLRRKVEEDPLIPRVIVTDPGVGYRIERP